MSTPVRSLLPIAAIIIVLAAAAVVVALITGPTEPDEYPPDSPEGAVQRYLQALQDRDFGTAYEMLSEAQREDTSRENFRSFFRWSSDAQQQVRLDDVDVRDDEAFVDITIDRFTGSGIDASRYSYSRTIPLVREDSEWKIDDTFIDLGWVPPERSRA